MRGIQEEEDGEVGGGVVIAHYGLLTRGAGLAYTFILETVDGVVGF